MPGVIIEQITKSFGPSEAVSAVSLEIYNGELLTILGPSGSGKTTLLRLIAGLEKPDAGQILIGGRVVCAESVWVPPQVRGIGMVFQNYALWPHLTTFENVAFPLQAAKLPSVEITNRVQEVMALTELAGLEKKRPGQLSGGEQQRVALARALVGRPSILLMDECLSNLDARLREKMAAELRRIQQALGITTIYVTHDQHEALALSDRMAVLHQGVLQQVGAPHHLYHRPRNALVAATLGAINLIPLAEAQELGMIHHPSNHPGDAILLGIRPENIRLVPAPDCDNHPATFAADGSSRVLGTVTGVNFMGDAYDYWIEVGNFTLQVRLPSGNGSTGRGEPILSPGDQARVLVDSQAWVYL